jgi:hypothetical protein
MYRGDPSRFAAKCSLTIHHHPSSVVRPAAAPEFSTTRLNLPDPAFHQENAQNEPIMKTRRTNPPQKAQNEPIAPPSPSARNQSLPRAKLCQPVPSIAPAQNELQSGQSSRPSFCIQHSEFSIHTDFQTNPPRPPRSPELADIAAPKEKPAEAIPRVAWFEN